MEMTSNKPYLIRAFYDWIVDNGLTPYILVNTAIAHTQVPLDHIRQDRIIFNISPAATRGLLLDNDRIVFTARFSGQTEQIFLPPESILEIYAKENGKGIAFAQEEQVPPDDGEGSAAPETKTKSGAKKPSLTLVKK